VALALPDGVFRRGLATDIDVNTALLLTLGSVEPTPLDIAVGARQPMAEAFKVLPAELAEGQFLLTRLNRRRNVVVIGNVEYPCGIVSMVQSLIIAHGLRVLLDPISPELWPRRPDLPISRFTLSVGSGA
jgi:hypothetical protein